MLTNVWLERQLNGRNLTNTDTNKNGFQTETSAKLGDMPKEESMTIFGNG